MSYILVFFEYMDRHVKECGGLELNDSIMEVFDDEEDDDTLKRIKNVFESDLAILKEIALT